MHYYLPKFATTVAALALCGSVAFAQDHGNGSSSTHSSGSSGSRSSSSSSRGSSSTRYGSESRSGSSGFHSYGGYSSHPSGGVYGSRGGDFGGSTHNLAGRVDANGHAEHIDPVHIDRAPSAVFHGHAGGALPAFEHGGLYRGGWRSGYYHYNHFFHDDHFFFGFYIFDPFAFGVCVCSPWYYYPCLPPYLAYGHAYFVTTYYSTDWVGTPYPYNPDPIRENPPALDTALHEITSSFLDDDRRALSRLVPRDGKVNIFTEGNYSYSLSADDFFDLYKDGIENVHTDHYTIEDVQVNSKGDARVRARHDYTDPWNKPQTVYHTYYLAHEGSEYVIREFGTSYYDK